MTLMEILDLLEDYLNEYSYLQASFNKTCLLLTRYKLNYTFDIIIDENSSDKSDYDGGVRQRNVNFTNDRKRKQSSIITKQDHIDSLRTAYTTLLHTKIIPLAQLKRKLATSLMEIESQIN